jgi:hypothetical protein
MRTVVHVPLRNLEFSTLRQTLVYVNLDTWICMKEYAGRVQAHVLLVPSIKLIVLLAMKQSNIEF